MYVVWPDGHGMVYDMAWWAWQVTWYDMESMLWFMVFSMGWRACRAYGTDLAAMVYGMAWCAWHGIWYRLEGIVWYMV